MIKIKRFTFNMFGENTYVLWDEDSREAAIVDPGMIYPEEQQEIARFVESNRLRLVHLVNTHLHVDHTFGEEFIKDNYGLKVEAHLGDEPFGLRRDVQARSFGLGISPMPLSIDVPLKEGDKIYLGNSVLEIIEVPGHSPGGIVVYAPKEGFALTGDSVFKGSIGRTDLSGGNHEQLLREIRRKVMVLPDSTVLYPGHGPETTVGEERRSNPFLLGKF